MKKDFKSIEELMKILTDTNLTDISFETEGFKVDLKRAKEVAVAEEVEFETEAENAVEEVAPLYEEVKSDNVGKFIYVRKDGEAIIKVGDQVKKGQQIGYIATIGVKSAVKSPFAGVIKEILVEDGSIADFGKTLIKIEAQ